MWDVISEAEEMDFDVTNCRVSSEIAMVNILLVEFLASARDDSKSESSWKRRVVVLSETSLPLDATVVAV